MLDAAQRAQRIAQEGNQARFEADEVFRLALERLVQIVGEAARRVAPETRAAYPAIPWAKITGMRNVLVHDDDDLDQETVWDTVTRHLPVLVAQLEQVLPPPPRP